jgi:hypothetical protein
MSTYLSAPAVAKDGPFLDSIFASQLIDNLRNARQRLRRRSGCLEEIAQLLLLLFGVWRVPGDVGGITLEEVGHEDLVLLVIRVGEDICTL